MRKLLSAALLLLSVLTTQAQDTNFVRHIIQQLSAPNMYGRSAAHSGDRVAALFLSQQLQQLDVQPLTEDYRQPLYYHAFCMEGDVQLTIDGQALSPHSDFRISSWAKTTHTELPLFPVNAKLLTDETALNAFIKKNAEKLQKSAVYIDISAINIKNKAAKKQFDKILDDLKYQNPFQSDVVLLGVEKLPIWSLTALTFERNFALIFVQAKQIKRRNRTVRIDFDNPLRYHEPSNVCGVVRGAACPDSLIVLTAHYDHVGCMGDSVYFPGAHDNASGVATLLDFARLFQTEKPHYSVALLFFAGEEAGLRGSYHFANNPLIDLDKVKLLINLDMLCGGAEGIMVVNAQADSTKPFYDLLVSENDAHGYVAAVKSRPNAQNSDHYFFTQRCPALFIYTLGGRIGGYHDTTDHCNSCGLDHYNGIFALLKKIVLN